MADFIEDLRFRGLIHQMTDPDLGARLNEGRMTGYTGFDPTADSLHVGHLLQVCNLRRLQDAGHRPIAVAGGGTGFIGDPGGKSEERSLLTVEQLEANLAGIRAQLARFIDVGTDGAGSKALMVNNADWLQSMTLFSFLRDVGKHFTVNQMVAKDSVKSRLARARASPTRNSATCSCRPTTSSGCSTTTGAPCRSGGATSGATSPWASS